MPHNGLWKKKISHLLETSAFIRSSAPRQICGMSHGLKKVKVTETKRNCVLDLPARMHLSRATCFSNCKCNTLGRIFGFFRLL